MPRVKVGGGGNWCPAAVSSPPSWVWATLKPPYGMGAASALMGCGVPCRPRMVSRVRGVAVCSGYEHVLLNWLSANGAVFGAQNTVGRAVGGSVRRRAPARCAASSVWREVVSLDGVGCLRRERKFCCGGLRKAGCADVRPRRAAALMGGPVAEDTAWWVKEQSCCAAEASRRQVEAANMAETASGRRGSFVSRLVRGQGLMRCRDALIGRRQVAVVLDEPFHIRGFGRLCGVRSQDLL